MTIIGEKRARFHKRVVSELLFKDSKNIVGNADSGSKASRIIALNLFEAIGGNIIQNKLPGQKAGRVFEQLCAEFLSEVSSHLRHLTISENQYLIEDCNIARFEQYEHLNALQQFAKEIPELGVTLSNDYVIKPDIMVAKLPVDDKIINIHENLVGSTECNLSPMRSANQSSLILHGSVSCKWTMRSDRAQNARSEALNLLRNRKGRSPHISVIVGEPLPSRIASLALGTGDVDCVYHFALPELLQAAKDAKEEEAVNLLNMMMSGKRLRDISDLPIDLLG